MKDEIYAERLEAAEEMLITSKVIEDGLAQLKKVIAPGAPFAVFELMNDSVRVEKLRISIAELYVQSILTIEDMEQIALFQSSEVGRKLSKLHIYLQPKIMELTQEWIYDIMEEARKAERTKGAQEEIS